MQCKPWICDDCLFQLFDHISCRSGECKCLKPFISKLHSLQLRRFALPFIYSHSDATGVFRNALVKVAVATSCSQKTLQTTSIGSFTAVCVVGVLGVIHCEYRQTFVLAMCGIVSFLM